MSPRRRIASRFSTAGSITCSDVFIVCCLVLTIIFFPNKTGNKKTKKKQTKKYICVCIYIKNVPKKLFSYVVFYYTLLVAVLLVLGKGGGGANNTVSISGAC